MAKRKGKGEALTRGNGATVVLMRRQLWLSVIVAVVAANAAIIGYVIQISDLRSTSAQHEQTIQDQARRIQVLEASVADNRLEITKTQLTQIEQDTQLRASIDDSNKSLAWQLRMDAMLWEQTSKGKIHLPTDNAFYPNIANGNSR